MSDLIYLQCKSHTPSIWSEPVATNLDALDHIRECISYQKEIAALWKRGVLAHVEFIDTKDGAAYRFMAEHPFCELGIIDEYTNSYPTEAHE